MALSCDSKPLPQGRGKTTLLSVLKNPSSSLPPNVSTVGVVVSDWTVHPPPGAQKKKATGATGLSQKVRPITSNY